MNNRLDKKMYSGWLAAPGFLIFIVIYVIPTLASFYFGFCTWNLRTTTWTGLANFESFFTMFNTKYAIPNTFQFAAIETLIVVVGGLLLAVVLTSGIKTQGYLKSVIFLPTLFGSVVVASAWSSIMAPNGLLNQALVSQSGEIDATMEYCLEAISQNKANNINVAIYNHSVLLVEYAVNRYGLRT